VTALISNQWPNNITLISVESSHQMSTWNKPRVAGEGSGKRDHDCQAD